MQIYSRWAAPASDDDPKRIAVALIGFPSPRQWTHATRGKSTPQSIPASQIRARSADRGFELPTSRTKDRPRPRPCENKNNMPCRFGSARFESINSHEIEPTWPKCTASSTGREFSHTLDPERPYATGRYREIQLEAARYLTRGEKTADNRSGRPSTRTRWG
jgi:hypothetical protein